MADRAHRHPSFSLFFWLWKWEQKPNETTKQSSPETRNSCNRDTLGEYLEQCAYLSMPFDVIPGQSESFLCLHWLSCRCEGMCMKKYSRAKPSKYCWQCVVILRHELSKGMNPASCCVFLPILSFFLSYFLSPSTPESVETLHSGVWKSGGQGDGTHVSALHLL